MPIQAPNEKPAIQHSGELGLVALAAVEPAFGPPDSAEIEAQGRKATPREGVVHVVHHLVVHGPAMFGMGMQEQRDRRVRVAPLLIPRLETPFRADDDDLRHGDTLRAPILHWIYSIKTLGFESLYSTFPL
jgi:hypothetical protein